MKAIRTSIVWAVSFCAGVTAVSSGCSMAPTYKRAAVPEPQAFKESPTPAEAPRASQPTALGKSQFTVYLERELVEELRDAANILAGDPHYLTISQIVTNGARAELRRLQDKHNGGKPFPHTGRRGQPGRRPSR